MWFQNKKKLEACHEIIAGLLETVEKQRQALGEYNLLVKRLFILIEGKEDLRVEATELKGRVDMQERIEECLRLELRLVKDKLLMRDLKPDISALERLYLFDDPRS